jgi:hypothetical protein
MDRSGQQPVIELLHLGVHSEVGERAMDLVLEGQSPLIETQYPKGQQFQRGLVKRPGAFPQCIGHLLGRQRTLRNGKHVQ